MPELTPEQVKRALAGDERLVRALVDTLTPAIQARAARALVRRKNAAGNREVRQEVEDLTQAVFVSLFASGGRTLLLWDPERGTLQTFVRWVAEREIASILRTRKQNPWTEDPTLDESLDQRPGSEIDPEVVAGSRELLASIVERLRGRISGKGQALFDLLILDGRSTEDVSSLMNMSPDAVYAWRSRLGRLAREIAAELVSEKRG